MNPSRHVITSFALGAIFWFFTKSISASLLCFLTGVLVDLDHIIEYPLHFDWRSFSAKNVYHASIHTRDGKGDYRYKKLYIVFHSWEMVILFWALYAYTKNIYFLAFSLGYTSHMFLDTVGNKGYPALYFLLGRIMNNFSTDKLMRKKCDGRS